MVQLVSSLHNVRRYDEALEWSELAVGVLDRISGHEEVQADLAHNTGRVYTKLAKWSEALKYEQKALGLLEKYAPNSYKRAKFLDALGNIYALATDPQMRDLEKATDSYLQAISIYDRLKGKRHPLGLSPHGNIISVYLARQDYARALEHAQLYYEIALANYGAESQKVNQSLEGLAAVYFESKRYAQALETAQRACELNKKLEGGETPEMRFCLENIGRSLVGLGRGAEAIPILEKDLKWHEADKSADLGDLGDVRFALAQALKDTRRDPERVISLASRARDDYTAAQNPKRAEEVERWLRSVSGPERGASRKRASRDN
jgi:tetratricopeptide (TPR) repeat protein